MSYSNISDKNFHVFNGWDTDGDTFEIMFEHDRPDLTILFHFECLLLTLTMTHNNSNEFITSWQNSNKNKILQMIMLSKPEQL